MSFIHKKIKAKKKLISYIKKDLNGNYVEQELGILEREESGKCAEDALNS